MSAEPGWPQRPAGGSPRQVYGPVGAALQGEAGHCAPAPAAPGAPGLGRERAAVRSQESAAPTAPRLLPLWGLWGGPGTKGLGLSQDYMKFNKEKYQQTRGKIYLYF